MRHDRRNFLKVLSGLIAAMGLKSTGFAREPRVRFPDRPWRMTAKRGKWPIVVASYNGLKAVEKAWNLMNEGTPAIDAVVEGVHINELDPNDMSVGYGGLPNADGVVELDAAVMDGHRSGAGAVGAIRGVKTPSSVAKLVMERTDHIFLVGQGATRFAREYGFKLEELLTPKARERWLRWRESLSNMDDYLDDEQIAYVEERPTGTIHLSAVDREGHVACVTTTSGLAFKIPGRVGDSPIIGAGLYCDEHVGSAGSTGRGEANIKICGAHTVVEMMRWGMHPKDACMAALKRALEMTKEKRLLDAKGRPLYQLKFYALRKDGVYGAAVMWSDYGGQFAVCDENGPRLEDCAYLFEGTYKR